MYRKEIKVLDCTIRDGGLMNNHLFSDDLVRRVFQAVNKSGVDYIELGYKADENQFKRGEFGPMKFCTEQDLENIVGDTERNCKISVMADIGRFDPKATIPKAESYVDMIRVASYVKDIDKAIDLVNTLNAKGYETTINIMAVSHSRERELDEALEQIKEGISLTLDQFKKVFAKHGIELVDMEGGFDPHFHEAVMRVDSDEHESGEIVQVLQKGYKIKDRVLRPAMVSISN